MFPNLAAEQARRKHTNEYIANYLGISRRAYEIKKKNGTFKLREINLLVELYNVNFEYLFMLDNTNKTA